MEIGISDKRLNSGSLVSSFVKELKANENKLGLEKAVLFNEFPIYKDLDEQIVIAQLLVISSKHGILLFHVTDSLTVQEFNEKQKEIINELDNLYSILFTRLLRNRALRSGRKDLKFPVTSIIYSPLVENKINFDDEEVILCQNSGELFSTLDSYKIDDISNELYLELKSTVEGSKAIIRTKVRENVKEKSKGDAANHIEKEIASFDQYQRNAYTSFITGVSRVRGLAGSGKTVVLAIKAALTHLKYPEAKIAYTYYTRSLNQHIKRLITRFYRQFEDNDPNWENLEIIHAWGSSYNPGVYYNACIGNNVNSLSYTTAASKRGNPFETVCNDFLTQVKQPAKIYDYIFIDEGQDFPPAFLKLCLEICNGQKILWAYDELQTIFLPKSPSAEDIFGRNERGESNINFEEDIILYKCYRNPREILLIAHALGFGIYGDKIVQMIESEEYWNDIGYNIVSGNLKAGEVVKIERPKENSLESISSNFSIDELIKVVPYKDYRKEVAGVAAAINADLDEGLLPEDILVITVDDRNASRYLEDIQHILDTQYNISSNNIHADKFSVRDFQLDGFVTLSTVHKAKGNEAYSVYIVGVDALYSVNPTIKERNILFTALTRSKGWVSISGVGEPVEILDSEIKRAKSHFPYLEFKYPSDKDLRVMQRDIKETAIRKSKSKKLVEQALSDLSPEEVKRLVDQISAKSKH